MDKPGSGDMQAAWLRAQKNAGGLYGALYLGDILDYFKSRLL
jgi:hypothetical protein